MNGTQNLSFTCGTTPWIKAYALILAVQDSTCHAGACLGLVPGADAVLLWPRPKIAAMSSSQALSQTFMPTFHDVPEYVPVCKAAKRYLLSFTRAFCNLPYRVTPALRQRFTQIANGAGVAKRIISHSRCQPDPGHHCHALPSTMNAEACCHANDHPDLGRYVHESMCSACLLGALLHASIVMVPVVIIECSKVSTEASRTLLSIHC